MILIDTDIMIDILRGYTPAIDWLVSLSDEEIVLPGFAVCLGRTTSGTTPRTRNLGRSGEIWLRKGA